MRIGFVALAVNFGLSVLFAWWLTRFAGTHAGLALAISIAAIVNAWLLFRGLRRDGLIEGSRDWFYLVARVVAANAVMTIVLVYINRPLDWWLAAGVWDRALWLGVLVLAGALAYFVAIVLLGARPAQFRHRSG